MRGDEDSVRDTEAGGERGTEAKRERLLTPQ